MEDKKIVAIIPARGGSKGIPGKNIREIGGKPMIAYTIEAAKTAPSINRILVSTDSREIAEIAIRYGAEVPFLRPAGLASDTAKTMDAVMYTLDELKKQGAYYDYMVLLQPTSPLRNGDDIEGCIQKAVSENADVVAISEVNDPPILMRYADDRGKLTALLDGNSTVRRQDMPLCYRVNGSVYVNKVEGLSEETSLNDNPVGYIMPKERSIDIDDMADLYLAEYYMRGASE